MRIEIYFLAFAIALGLLHVFIAAASSTKQRGLKWNMSSREANPPPLTGTAGRLDRALQNFKETFPLFVAAVLVVTASGQSGALSEIGCYAYVVGRAAYLPVYALGITVIRSLIWFVSVLGIIAVVAQAFVG